MISTTASSDSYPLLQPVFREAISRFAHGHGSARLTPLSRSAHARQATLHAARRLRRSLVPPCRFTPVSYRSRLNHLGSTLLHNNRSPQKKGRDLHAIAGRPSSAGALLHLPSAPTPNWAYEAGTKGFTVMPFKGFLGPSSEAADLTRILHRR